MDGSRWGSLLVRAAARGLLDPEDGCPVTQRYLLRELLVLQDVSREAEQQLGMAMIDLYSNSAQIYSQGPYDVVHTKLFEAARDQALLSYQQLGRVTQPWDQAWAVRIKETKERLYDRQNVLGETGITDRGLIDMVSEYEQLKREREQQHGSGNSADD